MLKTCFSTAAWRGIGLAVLALAASCTYSHGPDPTPTPTSTNGNPCNDPNPPTYAAVVAPIIAARCQGCHSAQGGLFDLSTHQALARSAGGRLMGTIRHDAGFSPMPRGGAKLSDCDIARIQAWIDAGSLNN